MRHISFFSTLARAFQIPTGTSSTLLPVPLRTSNAANSQLQQTSSFSSTAWLGKKKGPTRTKDRRITMIRYALSHPVKHIPRPLRFSRLRALRHWTIHRAWQLWQRKQRTSHELQLERQWESMRSACEELRLNVGDGGRLFRAATTRKGIFGGRSNIGDGGIRKGGEPGDNGRVPKGSEAGVPIEYARGLVDAPSKDGWDHAWTRS